MSRQVNTKAIELIQSFEQRRLKSYNGAADRPDVYTIGWGHVLTGHEVPDLFQPGQMMKDVSITPDMAEQLFETDINKFASGVQMRIPPEVTQELTEDQFGALVSLAYNIGLGNFNISAVLRTLKVGNIKDAAIGFKSWTKSGGEIQKGLVRRRAAEMALYRSDYDKMSYFMAQSSPTAINKASDYLEEM